MAKRGLKRTWGCDYGCDISKKPCKHIESYIADSNGSISREVREKAAMYEITEERIHNQDEYEKKHFKARSLLVLAGLSKENAAIVMESVVDKMSTREVAALHGFKSNKSIVNILDASMKVLKEKGYLKTLLRRLNEQ